MKIRINNWVCSLHKVSTSWPIKPISSDLTGLKFAFYVIELGCQVKFGLSKVLSIKLAAIM